MRQTIVAALVAAFLITGCSACGAGESVQDGGSADAGSDAELPSAEEYTRDVWEGIDDDLSASLVTDEDGTVTVALGGVPDGMEYRFGGCNYPSVVTAVDGVPTVMSTIEDKEVTVGYTLIVQTTEGELTHDTRDLAIMVPAQEGHESLDAEETIAGISETRGAADTADVSDADTVMNERPGVIPSIQEWDGDYGVLDLTSENVDWIQDGSLTDSPDGQVRYDLISDESLGDEGYRIDLGCGTAEDADGIHVYAYTETGLYWGNVTLRQMIVLAMDDESEPAENGTEDHGTVEDDAAEDSKEDNAADNSAEEDDTAWQRKDGDETPAAGDVYLARGRIRDYPVGSVRGMMLDVGRNTMSLHQIYEIAQNLSWYKMNELTLHLQDNALLTYSDKTDHVSTAYEAYSAFRMESSITGEEGRSITAEDMRYSAEDMAALVEACAAIHVSIIPEIDTPAHSLALTSVFPELGLSARPDSVDMLDCSNEEALLLACRVWDEQLETAFAGATTIQIGGDEYYGQANDFLQYEQGLIEHLSTSGKTIRMWGSLTALAGDSEISSIVPGSLAADAGTDTIENIADFVLTSEVKHNIEGAEEGDTEEIAVPEAALIAQQEMAEEGILPVRRIQMQLWSTYWADPEEMYAAGFELINSSSNRLYINCGEATDYLDKESVYNTYRRTDYTMTDGTVETLPGWSPRLLGSSAALWNDLIDNLEIGICEYDMTDRVLDALPVLAERFWEDESVRGYADFAEDAEVIGTNPDSDPLDQANESLLGPDYEVSFEVYLPADAELSDEEARTLFRAERDGNTYALYVQEDGRIGFSREFYDYTFDGTLQTDTWVQVTIVGHKDTTALYVDGALVDTLGSSEAYEEHATFLFPMQVNEGFAGEIREVTYR